MGSSRLPTARGPALMLGFQFRDPSLFQRALVHRSYCNEHGLDASESYERLEFLGDAVLELTISAHLFRQFPDADEGQLTKVRSSLVRGEMLAQVARRLGLGEHLLVGRGVEASGGRYQDSVLAASLEAVLAAVYLDQGLEAAREFVSRHMAPELAEIIRSGPPPENPKSRLQELLQGQGRPTPVYRLSHQEGPDHNPVFSVEALVGDEVIGTGRGSKKAEAERAAAQAALAQLLSDPAQPNGGANVAPPVASSKKEDSPPRGGAAGAPRHASDVKDPVELPPPHSAHDSGEDSGTAPRILRRLGLGRKRLSR